MSIDVDCPKCGHTMERVEGSEWALGERASVTLRCPECLHEEPVWLRPRKQDKE